MVFNGTSDFVIHAGGQSGPARFITASLDGVIAGWNPNVPTPGSSQAFVAASVPGAAYTGLDMGSNASGNFLYAANFGQGRIDVFDRNFHLTTLAGDFQDPDLPPGLSPFKPFNVDNIDGTLYVTYANGADREHGGIVDAFDTNGNFLRRVVTGGLNAPWGVALAPNNFGQFSGDLLVGNFGFGDGKINAFDPSTGEFLGYVSDANGQPLAIEGLWYLTFGNGVNGGDSNALYFTAGINRTGPNSFGALDGLFGSIRAVTPGGSAAAPFAAARGDGASLPAAGPAPAVSGPSDTGGGGGATGGSSGANGTAAASRPTPVLPAAAPGAGDGVFLSLGMDPLTVQSLNRSLFTPPAVLANFLDPGGHLLPRGADGLGVTFGTGKSGDTPSLADDLGHGAGTDPRPVVVADPLGNPDGQLAG
jgi:uncharacterized protein (TIGR03118 family)